VFGSSSDHFHAVRDQELFMSIRASIVLLVLVAAAACGSCNSHGPFPTTTSMVDPTAQSKETLRHLAEKTRSLAGFTATYRVVSSVDGDWTLRFVYSAPDRGKFEIHSKRESMTDWVLDGGSIIRGEDERGLYFATLSGFDDVVAGLDRFNASNGSTSSSRAAAMAPGPTFVLDATPGSASGDRKAALSFSAGWYPLRRHVLGWFETAQTDDRWRDEGEKLVREDSGVRVALSKSTGFITSMTSPSGGRVELVDFRESFDESEFTIPTASALAKDRSAEMAVMVATGMVALLRHCVYEDALDATPGRPDDETLRQRELSRLFASLHRPSLVGALAPFVADTSKSIDDFAETCRRSNAIAARDAALKLRRAADGGPQDNGEDDEQATVQRGRSERVSCGADRERFRHVSAVAGRARGARPLRSPARQGFLRRRLHRRHQGPQVAQDRR